MGLGRLGRGVGNARFLAEQGAEVLVTDKKDEEELRESVDELRGYENITFRLGEHREEDFRDSVRFSLEG
jgi:UDP-N-acetylmuramoylalanine--D-glutamate ligase